MEGRAALEAIFRAGVEACLPERVLPPHLPHAPEGRTLVLAVGKAAAGMAQVVEDRWRGPLTGLVVAPHGQPASFRQLQFRTAAHPIPDGGSFAAAERLLELAAGARADDLVLVLLSGGASSLACLPAEGWELGEKQALTTALLRSGASIGEINCVRRHLSRIKGGRLGQAVQPARLVTLAISDVASGTPEDIGSGPTVPDRSTCEDACSVLLRYGIGRAFPWTESVSPADAAGWRSEYRIVASGATALDAAAATARSLGYEPVILEKHTTGEARAAALRHAEQAMRARASGRKCALISGGELTVTVSGQGGGGPNQEYALAFAIGLDGAAGVRALAGDTDGIDGNGEAAGAFVDVSSLARARLLGFSPEEALRRNDSGTFFAALGDQLVTGPTGTNVNDLRIILVDPRPLAPAQRFPNSLAMIRGRA